jgi:hypothetical protein
MNGPIDLIRGLFSSLEIGTYIPATFGPLCTFLGPFEGAQIPQSGIKQKNLIVQDYFSHKNGTKNLVWCPF